MQKTFCAGVLLAMLGLLPINTVSHAADYAASSQHLCQRRFKADPPYSRIAGVNLTHLSSSQLSDCAFPALWPCQDPSPPLVLQPVAFSRDLDDRGVMQEAIEHGGGQHGVAGEGLVPAAER